MVFDGFPAYFRSKVESKREMELVYEFLSGAVLVAERRQNVKIRIQFDREGTKLLKRLSKITRRGQKRSKKA